MYAIRSYYEQLGLLLDLPAVLADTVGDLRQVVLAGRGDHGCSGAGNNSRVGLHRQLQSLAQQVKYPA